MKMVSVICLYSAFLFALDPPQPIQGVPNLTVGKSFRMVAGNTAFVFTFPEKWGMENASASESGGNFMLFPSQGGYGCKVRVVQWMDEMSAKEEMERLKSTFAKTNAMTGGFEAFIENARYACYVHERYLNEIWYSLPKATSVNGEIWEKLKQCISVSEVKLESTDEAWAPIQQIPWEGWVCNHPDNRLHVLLETSVTDKVKLGQDSKFPYLLQIEDFNSSGYFYVKWDQKNLEGFESYGAHLNEVKAHILSLEKEQKFEKDPLFNKEESWACLKGKPYTIISLSGEGFLFAFALKNKNSWRSFDFNSYIQRVKWWHDE